MKKLFAIWGIMLLSASFAAYAHVVPEEDALRKASVFLQSSLSPSKKFSASRGMSKLKLQTKGKALKTGAPSCYLFVGEDGKGFVIVAGDDRVANPVLGYSLSGRVDGADIPDNMKSWLDDYAEQIDYMLEQGGKSKAGEQQTGVGKAVVGPLVQTQWNQSKPFNDKCPMGAAGRAPVGCVAVAMGQIMNYHRWPARSNGVVDYDANLTWVDEDLSDYSYDYDNLDIPQFLFNVAASCRTEFDSYASSSTDVDAGKGLLESFDYDKGMEYHLREPKYCKSTACNYTETRWDSLLRAELDEHRPIYYAGSNIKNGHAFVCDGYDDSGYFHFNWGWGGSYDGWFLTSALEPGETYYNSNQSVITHIQPNRGNGYWTKSHISGEYSSHSVDAFADTVRGAYCVENYATGEKRYFKECDFVKEKSAEINISFHVFSYADDYDLPDGTYTGYQVYSVHGGPWTSYTPCDSEMETFGAPVKPCV